MMLGRDCKCTISQHNRKSPDYSHWSGLFQVVEILLFVLVVFVFKAVAARKLHFLFWYCLYSIYHAHKNYANVKR